MECDRGVAITIPTPATTSGSIVVGGKVQENVAEVKTETKGTGQTVATITLNQGQIKTTIESLPEIGGVQAPIIQIPVTRDADIVNAQLNGQMVKDMESKAVLIEIKTEKASYVLPAEEINIDGVSRLVGEDVKLSDISVHIEIAKPSDANIRFINDLATKGNFILVAPPIQFNITCTYNNKTVAINQFNNYIERNIAIPEGIDPTKITTGVIVDPSGAVRHVPTKLVIIDGKYYAQINSLTNSTYTVIWNPIEFEDVNSHWAKEVINDMGSRMVVSGVGNGMFDPDRDITRAEFAAILVRALGLQPGIGNNPFTDVRDTDWYYHAIKTAVEYKLISGYGNGRFGPLDKITREQAMAMIERAMKITGLTIIINDNEVEKLLATFEDANQGSEWAKASMATCIKAEIVSGRSGKLIAPKDNITRAEVAVIVKRLLQKSDLI